MSDNPNERLCPICGKPMELKIEIPNFWNGGMCRKWLCHNEVPPTEVSNNCEEFDA